MICEVCKKEKPDVRFEGSFDGDICDSCLLKIKTDDYGKLGKDALISYLLDFYNNNSLDEETEILVLDFLEKQLKVDISLI